MCVFFFDFRSPSYSYPPIPFLFLFSHRHHHPLLFLLFGVAVPTQTFCLPKWLISVCIRVQLRHCKRRQFILSQTPFLVHLLNSLSTTAYFNSPSSFPFPFPRPNLSLRTSGATGKDHLTKRNRCKIINKCRKSYTEKQKRTKRNHVLENTLYYLIKDITTFPFQISDRRLYCSANQTRPQDGERPIITLQYQDITFELRSTGKYNI